MKAAPGRRARRRIAWWVRGAAVAVLLSTHAFAQTASQVVPQSFRPALQRQGGAVVVPENIGSETPPGAEALSVRLRDVVIQDGLPSLAEAGRELRASLAGQEVTLARIFSAARQLEQDYIRAGYPLVRVTLPPQTLVHGGDLRLLVIDGVIERVDTSALPSAIRPRVDAVLGPIVGMHGLTLADLERALLIAGDMPGTVLRSALATGSRTGTSVLVVEARTKVLTGQFSVDNTLSKSLGSINYSTGFDLNSALGHGELVYLRANGAPYTGGTAAWLSDTPRNRSLAFGVVAPIGPDGFSVNVEATMARTTPKVAPGVLVTSSEFQRLSTRLRYPLVRSRELTINAEASLDIHNESLSAVRPVSGLISVDRLRILRNSVDLTWITPTDPTLTGKLPGSFGFDALGARKPPGPFDDEPPLSRLGSRPEFQKAELALSFNQPLADHLVLDVRARGQLSFNQSLPRAEQIGLATSTGLSAFDAGLFQGDEGFVVRGEIQFPFQISWTLPFGLPSWPEQDGVSRAARDETPGLLVVSPYGFGAFGQIHLHQPTLQERFWVRGVAYGAGLRISTVPDSSFTVLNASIEYGRQQRSDGQKTEDRVTFSTMLQF